MRDGISWRGSHRCRGWQQEYYYNPNQSLVLPSGRQARSRRAANVLVLFLILCFVTWTLTVFRTPPTIVTDSLPQPVPTRAVVLELFRYHRRPQVRNRSFTALAPVHRRRRGLLEDSETRVSTPKEIFDEEEQEGQASDGQGVGYILTREFNSFKKRRGSHSDDEATASSQETSESSPRAALKEFKWPVDGGVRKSDHELKPLYAIVPIGYYRTLRDYHLIIDTGSGITWVNCRGSPMVGDNGQFHPLPDSFVNCEEDRNGCKNFQGGGNYPCDGEHKFRCFFQCTYVDGSEARGSIIEADVRFDRSDGSVKEVNMAFGCAADGKRADPGVEDEDSKGEDEAVDSKGEDDEDDPTSDAASDGTLGLGPHSSSWLRQLHLKGLVSEYVVAVCLEPARSADDPSRSDSEHAGFISFGDLYTTQAASTIWTTSVVPNPTNSEQENFAIYEAKLVKIKYRMECYNLRLSKIKLQDGAMVAPRVQMGFDTGSAFTFLPRRIFRKILNFLEEDARNMGYSKTEEKQLRNSKRTCWRDKSERKKSLVREFGDLIMQFSSPANDRATSDFVIKPEYYLTYGGDDNIITCFNIRETIEDLVPDSPSGILGAEAMSGHLLIFREQPGLIGWSPVTSCRNVRSDAIAAKEEQEAIVPAS